MKGDKPKMNIVDRTISFFNPVKGLQRQYARQMQSVINPQNSGYDAGGASTTKRSMRGFNAESYSPQSDIDYNLNILRERSRVLEMTSPLAAAAVNTTVTKTVGSGIYVKPCIDYEYLGLTKKEAEEWERLAEREFLLWSESKHCDAACVHNFYEMQDLIFRGMISNGDGFAVIKYQKPVPYMPYELRLQLIESDRVCTPYGGDENCETYNFNIVEGRAKNGNRVVSGIEIDDDGKKVAYYICNRYPNEYIRLYNKMRKWKRIEAYGAKTGNPNVLHLYNATRAGAYRGVPLLAVAIEPLKQLTRYSEAELMASVVSSMFTVFVTTNGSSANNPLSGMANPFAAQGKSGVEPMKRSNVDEITMGNGAITMLEEGEKIEVANPSRPNSNYDGFVMSLFKQIGASLEIPYEVLLKSYTSSYSASRAALLEAAEVFKKRRTYLVDDFCQPTYEIWLAEAVATGRIPAKGFFSDPLIHKAWCGAKWNATATVPVLDPTKEVQAAKMRVEEGFSTREAETTALNGSDYRTNVAQLVQENEKLIEATKILKSVDKQVEAEYAPEPIDEEQLIDRIKGDLNDKQEGGLK